MTEKPLSTDERARLRELEEENRRLKMERDFLKKAARLALSMAQPTRGMWRAVTTESDDDE